MTSVPACEGRARRLPSAKQEAGPHQTPNSQLPDLGLPASRAVRDKDLLLRHPVCGVCHSHLS